MTILTTAPVEVRGPWATITIRLATIACPGSGSRLCLEVCLGTPRRAVSPLPAQPSDKRLHGSLKPDHGIDLRDVERWPHLWRSAVAKVGVGYPDRWRAFPSFTVTADDPVRNLERANLAFYRYQVGKLGKAPDRGEWWKTLQTVNVVKLPLQNAFNFPAAFLQTPFFDPHNDAAANYGAVGAVIEHEISHSFDNLGSNFDSTGRLHNWWTETGLERFEQSAGRSLQRL